VPLAGAWAVGERPSFPSPQMGANNKAVHSTAKTTAGRWQFALERETVSHEAQRKYLGHSAEASVRPPRRAGCTPADHILNEHRKLVA